MNHGVVVWLITLAADILSNDAAIPFWLNTIIAITVALLVIDWSKVRSWLKRT